MRDRLAFIAPMMPTLVDLPPRSGEWLTEVKFDGWRCQISIESSGARVFTRRGHDWTDKLKVIADAAQSELRMDSAIIDGELVYPHESGRSDFHALQAVIRSSSDKLVFLAFDLLHLNGEDLRSGPVEERRDRLSLLVPAGGRIQFSDSLQGTPAQIFASIERMNLEGIVCKRPGSSYVSGVSHNWLKVKTFAESDLELLGVHHEPGKAAYALMAKDGDYIGAAVITFPKLIRDRFRKHVEDHAGEKPVGAPDNQPAVWLRPGTIGRVRHLRGEEKLRHARLFDFR